MIDFSQVTDITLGSTPVEQITDSQGNVLWSAAPVVLPNYFYVEDVSGSDNTLSIVKSNANAPTIEVFKSTDQENWVSMGTTDTTAITTTIPANGKLYLKATTDYWFINYYVNKIDCSSYFNVGGYIMSLLNGDNYQSNELVDITNNYAFGSLFSGSSNLVSAEDLVLPTNVTPFCYSGMFAQCTSLTTAPVLPATTLANRCYGSMFNMCTSLTTAPTLPATTLSEWCYSNMFYGTAITTAPALPATALAERCYSSMFSHCTSLTTAPALPATTLAKECYDSMFNMCTSLTTAPTLPATTLAEHCYMNMFYGCTGLTTAPVLPATTLVKNCYMSMFNGCTSLNEVTTYAQDISATNCLDSWLYNVAATGDFYNLGGATYESGGNGIPSGWTVHTSL